MRKNICKDCKEECSRLESGMCPSCYNYYRKGGKNNPLPKKGTIEYDDRGYPICHICGKAYRKLGQHAYSKHKMTSIKYRDRFGLYRNCNLNCEEYNKQMSNYAYKYKMAEQLIIVGEKTRLKKGDKLRLGTGRNKEND